MASLAVSSRSISPGEIASVSSLIVGPDGKPIPYTPQSRLGFGAGVPLRPRIQGAIEPRIYDYRFGINTALTPRLDEGLRYSFAGLRGLVALCTYARLAVNYRKNQFRALRLEFTAKEGVSKASALAEVQAAEAFWAQPDPARGAPGGRPRFGGSFSNWIASAMEEVLVTDGLYFFVRRGRIGQLVGLEQIKPDTIKPVLDDTGSVVFYQQILYGMVASEYGPEDLLYLPYNVTVGSSYGSPPAEEIAPTVNIAIRRTVDHLARYTEGNVPSAFLEAPEGWTADQIAEAQVYLDETFSGNDSQRHKLRLIPHGSNYTQAFPFQFSKDEDESILTQVVQAYQVPRSTFVAQVNRATAESNAAESIDSGRIPLEIWWAAFINWVTKELLGLRNVRAGFTGGSTANVKDEAEADVALAGGPIFTVNERRAMRGLDPLPGWDKLAGASDAKPGDTGGANGKPDGSGAANVSGDGAAGGDERGTQNAGASSLAGGDGGDTRVDAAGDQDGEAVAKSGTVASASSEAAQAAREELATWRRFALKPERVRKGRWAENFDNLSLGDVAGEIRHLLTRAKTLDEVKAVFDSVVIDGASPFGRIARALGHAKTADEATRGVRMNTKPTVPPEDATGAAKLRAEVAAPSGTQGANT